MEGFGGFRGFRGLRFRVEGFRVQGWRVGVWGQSFRLQGRLRFGALAG